MYIYTRTRVGPFMLFFNASSTCARATHHSSLQKVRKNRPKRTNFSMNLVTCQVFNKFAQVPPECSIRSRKPNKAFVPLLHTKDQAPERKSDSELLADCNGCIKQLICHIKTATTVFKLNLVTKPRMQQIRQLESDGVLCRQTSFAKTEHA